MTPTTPQLLQKASPPTENMVNEPKYEIVPDAEQIKNSPRACPAPTTSLFTTHPSSTSNTPPPTPRPSSSSTTGLDSQTTLNALGRDFQKKTNAETVKNSHRDKKKPNTNTGQQTWSFRSKKTGGGISAPTPTPPLSVLLYLLESKQMVEIGKLGHGKCVPTVLSALKEIPSLRIDSLSTHSIAISVDGVLYTRGNGDKYRLGYGLEMLLLPFFVGV